MPRPHRTLRFARGRDAARGRPLKSSPPRWQRPRSAGARRSGRLPRARDDPAPPRFRTVIRGMQGNARTPHATHHRRLDRRAGAGVARASPHRQPARVDGGGQLRDRRPRAARPAAGSAGASAVVLAAVVWTASATETRRPLSPPIAGASVAALRGASAFPRPRDLGSIVPAKGRDMAGRADGDTLAWPRIARIRARLVDAPVWRTTGR